MAIPEKPTITAPPNDLPTRGENETNFSNKINNLVAWYPDLTNNLNGSIDWMDTVFTAVEGEVASAEQAVTDAEAQVVLAQQAVTDAEAQVTEAETIKDNVASTANFAGLWSELAGSVAPPLSVYHSGQYWQLLVALADVTSVEPGTDVGTWLPIAETALDIGSITYSFDDLTASGLFVETGMSYLQSAYPELFGVIGIGEAPPITKLTEPANLPGTSSRDLAVSTNDDYVVVVGAADPKVTLYSRSGDTLTREDFVNSTDSHVTAGGNSDLSLVLVGCAGAPYLKLYSRSGGVLTEETAPSTGLSGATTAVEGCGFNFDGSYAAMLSSLNSFDNLKLYSVSGTTLTEIDAVDTPTGASSAVSLAVHPSQNYLVCGFEASNILELYDFSTGVLTLDQTVVEGSGGRPSNFRKSVQWSPDGNYLLVGCDDGLVRVFGFSGGTLTEITQTYSGESGTPVVRSASVNSDGDYITLGFTGSPYVKAYKLDSGVITGSGFVSASVPSENIQVVISSPYTVYTYTLLETTAALPYYKSDFPFNTATEFYVPDVDPLSPQQIGDWIPGVQGTAYVRAK